MKRSTDRILTTHAGSLPRPPDLLALVERDGPKAFDEPAPATRLSAAVAEIVRRQAELGIDVIDDGEYGKPSFVSYINERLGGYEIDTKAGPRNQWATSREGLSFPEFYAGTHAASRQTHMVCTGPITYKGHARLQRDIDNLKAALDGAKVEEVFMPAISPSNIEDWQRNAYYKSQEEYVFAIAEAMREEYEAIVKAGLLLQIDDPRLVTYYIIHPEASIADCRKWAEVRVSALNHALRNIARENPFPHLLRHQYGAAHPRHGAQRRRRHHSENTRRRLFVRGGESAPRARMESVEERETAGRQDFDPGRDLAFDGFGRASRTGGRAHRAVCRRGRPRKRDRRLRLRLCHLRRIEGGPSLDRLGQIKGALGRRADRVQGIVGTLNTAPRCCPSSSSSAGRCPREAAPRIERLVSFREWISRNTPFRRATDAQSSLFLVEGFDRLTRRRLVFVLALCSTSIGAAFWHTRVRE
jgi:methionine synthase II (cobalamin-independent)